MILFKGTELFKLFELVISNKKITFSNNSIVSRNTLIEMYKAIGEKRYFQLTAEQVTHIKTAFIKNHSVLNDRTPRFIRQDDLCALSSIKIDPNSILYYDGENGSVIKECKICALKKKLILRKGSPTIFRSDFEIVISSILQDPFSVDYALLSAFSNEEREKIIKILLNTNYVINRNTSIFLGENIELILHSFKLDKKSIDYISNSIKTDPKLFKYLIENGYVFNSEALQKINFNRIDSEDMLKIILVQTNVYEINRTNEMRYFQQNPSLANQEKFKERFNSLLYKVLSSKPTISGFKEVFEYAAETSWNKYKNENISIYTNLFGKIRAELQSEEEFENIIARLEFMYTIEETLGEEKFALLHDSMKKYYEIYHHSSENLESIDAPRDMIAKLSALFIAMKKEEYKKERLKKYYKNIQYYFIPKKDNQVVKKRLINYLQMKKMYDLYIENNPEITEFIKNLISQFSNTVETVELDEMINMFITHGIANLDSFNKAPYGYTSHKRKLAADKLINRLNSKFIKYTDLELNNYRDIIKYDENKDIYYYAGPTYTEEQVEKYKKYLEKQKIYEEIKKQIVFKAKSISIDYDSVEINDYWDKIGEIPFNDDYYEFDAFNAKRYSNFVILDFYKAFDLYSHCYNPESFLDDDAYKQLTDFIINNNLIWLFVFLNRDRIDDISYQIDQDETLKILDNFYKIAKVSKTLNYNITSFGDIKTLNNLSQCSDESAIAILGMELIEKLCTYKDYTDNESKKIISIAKDLVCEMSKRGKSTVPYVEGKTSNYHYSIYDTQDVDLLLAGINTSACFRVNGVDNDFLHYCALNKNGVVIKITDEYGNFVARAAGFRNGNAVYFNQLRTVNDIGGSGYRGYYEKERQEIIEAFKCACADICKTSMSNNNEEEKIEYIFVTQSYALGRTRVNLSRDIINKIGSKPMVNDSHDWKSFVRNTKNLERCDIYDGFTVDYGGYSLICMYDAKNDQGLDEIDYLENININRKDVPALYKRPRSKIICTDKPDIETIRKINKISGIFSYFTGEQFIRPNITDASLIFVGDNWFIIIKDKVITQYCIIPSDNHAIKEYKTTIDKLVKDNIIDVKNQQEKDNKTQIRSKH